MAGDAPELCFTTIFSGANIPSFSVGFGRRYRASPPRRVLLLLQTPHPSKSRQSARSSARTEPPTIARLVPLWLLPSIRLLFADQIRRRMYGA